MKRIIITGFFISILSACNSDGESSETVDTNTSTTTTIDNTQTGTGTTDTGMSTSDPGRMDTNLRTDTSRIRDSLKK